MTKKTTQKIVLTSVQDISLDKLVLAQTNVRRIQNGLSIEELAADIARRGLLQNLCVRPELDESGEPTGRYEVPAGGRRFRALQLLVRQKRIPKNAPVPCSVRTDGLAEEDSLAENVQRVALHPLIGHLKKADMAREAERLLAETGWLPEPLRLVDHDDGQAVEPGAEADAGDDAALPDFLSEDGDEEADEIEGGDALTVAAE